MTEVGAEVELQVVGAEVELHWPLGLVALQLEDAQLGPDCNFPIAEQEPEELQH